jgi:hypothetical protein
MEKQMLSIVKAPLTKSQFSEKNIRADIVNIRT